MWADSSLTFVIVTILNGITELLRTLRRTGLDGTRGLLSILKVECTMA